MFVNQLPTDIKDYELLKSMTLKQLLDLRATSKEWNDRVLAFLRTYWLPKMQDTLDSKINDISDKYYHILYGNLGQLVHSANPAKTRQETHNLQLELIATMKIVNTMLKVMETIIKQDSFQASTGTVTKGSLTTLLRTLTEQKNQTVTILRKINPQYESEMELSMYEIEHMAGGGRKQFTADQKRQIMAAIDECLGSREHTSGARGSTRQTHQEGMTRRKQDMFNSAKRAYQVSGRTFQSVLDQVQRC